LQCAVLALEYTANFQGGNDLVHHIAYKECVAFARGASGVGKKEYNVVCGGRQICQTCRNAVQHLQVGRGAVMDLVYAV
jgi:hypothetical protein